MKKVKITTIILAIILVTLVAFAGVYIKTQNRMEDKVKDYTLGRELSGERVIEVKVATGEDSKPNPEDLTEENYEIVKKTIEKRLQSFGAQDYTISLNYENGTIIVELPEDANTDTYAYLLTASSKVQMKEKDGETKLLEDSMIKKALYTYTSDSEGKYQVYLQLYLTKEGQAKFDEIKNNYAVFENEVEEIEKAEEEAKKEKEKAEGENATQEEKKDETEKTEETRKIAVLTIAGTEYDIEKIEDNKVFVKIGQETTNNTSINNSISAAAEIATLINSGKYPIEYELGENRFTYSDITKMQMIYFAIAIVAILLIVFVVFTVKYKTKGLLVSISCIGFISILLLLLRYTNVNISIEGIFGIILSIIINLIVNQIMAKDTKNIDYKELLLKLAPIAIITLTFCFAGWTNLNSFGMIMFWGLVLTAVYNLTVTKTLLNLKENK